MIIKIIKYSYNLYYIPNEIFQIRRFNLLLQNETPYIDDTMKTIGHYQELLSKNEIDEEYQTELEYDKQEELNSIDLDDFDE